MPLPAQYSWLQGEPGPKVLLEAVKLYGTVEGLGTADNPSILEWAKEIGETDYVHDSIAWCGLFLAICAKRAGYAPARVALRALSWASWGIPVPAPALGDVLTFVREGGGHVGLYVGEDNVCYHVLGGNQSDQVRIARIAKARLHAARRCAWIGESPANIRRVHLSALGAVSTNEA
jgi:uncharacterized protein (TIGR02594 family)